MGDEAVEAGGSQAGSPCTQRTFRTQPTFVFGILLSSASNPAAEVEVLRWLRKSTWRLT